MSVSSNKPEANKGGNQAHQHSDADSLLRKKEFGGELTKARKALSLTIADVADKLLISEDIVKAIENSQAEDLPALTFTRGYIRSYARLVGVSAEEIISAYLSVVPDQSAPLSAHSALPAQASSSHLFIKIISAGLVLFAVIFLFFKLYDSNTTLYVPDSTQADSPAMGVVATEELSTNDSSRNEFSAGETKTADPEVSEPAKAAEGDQASSGGGLESNSDVIKADSALKPHVPVVTTRTAETEAVATLVLNAVDSSWVEVKDATEKRLYYQLLDAGEQISLGGQPPYSVFLGNARQVRVEINNQIVDFDHLIKGNRKTVNMKVEGSAAVSLNLRR